MRGLRATPRRYSGRYDGAVLRPGAAEIDLTDALRALDQDGWARVGPVVAGAALDALRARADDLMHGRVVHEGLFFQHDSATGRYDELTYGRGWEGPSSRYRKIEKLERDPLVLALIENPLFERIARARIAGGVALYRAVLFSKAAGGGTELPWHQDGGRFWGVDRAPTLQIWTALDDAPVEAGCLEIVPGTHRAGLVTPEGGVVPPARVAAAPAPPVLVPAVAGEVVLIHNHVWHRSGLNRTDRPRRALTACYMDAETRCLRRKHAPRVFRRVFVG
jgi:hypothetical protein